MLNNLKIAIAIGITSFSLNAYSSTGSTSYLCADYVNMRNQELNEAIGVLRGG